MKEEVENACLFIPLLTTFPKQIFKNVRKIDMIFNEFSELGIEKYNFGKLI